MMTLILKENEKDNSKKFERRGIPPLNLTGQKATCQLVMEDLYLEEVRRMPLTPPKVERATATGMRKANWPYSLPAKVCKQAD